MRRQLINTSRSVFGKIFKIKSFEKKLVDSTSSLYKWRGMLVPSWDSYTKPSLRKTVIDGLSFTLDISDYMDWKAYFRIGLEESKAIFNRVKEDYVVIDVGANLGYYALHFAQNAKNGKVLCFEPDPANYEKLERNISQNKFKNINLYNYGLGKESGTFYLGVIDENNTGMNSIVSADNKDAVSHNEIHIKPLDEVEAAKELNKIDLIKVDIEGYEYHFLEGAKEIIQKHHPMIFMELCDNHLRRQDSSAKEVISLLRELGYNSIVNTENQAAEVEISTLDDCQFDIICTKK